MRCKRIERLPKSISDHNPIIMEIKGKELVARRWRLNELLLEDENIVKKEEYVVKDYFEKKIKSGYAIKHSLGCREGCNERKEKKLESLLKEIRKFFMSGQLL